LPGKDLVIGVEHIAFRNGILDLAAVNRSVTPSGVEHKSTDPGAKDIPSVNRSVTPSGVEHSGTSMATPTGTG
jgi:hypothetical protein